MTASPELLHGSLETLALKTLAGGRRHGREGVVVLSHRFSPARWAPAASCRASSSE
jgi:hypothetical protein